MFFELKGRTYGVKFQREETSTLAYWVEVDPELGIQYTGEVGIATLDSRDKFVKSIGRKIALTNLLDILSDPRGVEEAETSILLDKEDRAVIWQEYFRSHKK